MKCRSISELCPWTVPKLIQLNLLLQQSDLIIHLMYDTLFDTLIILLSQFMSPQIVT